jgi:hypothetical protein
VLDFARFFNSRLTPCNISASYRAVALDQSAVCWNNGIASKVDDIASNKMALDDLLDLPTSNATHHARHFGSSSRRMLPAAGPMRAGRRYLLRHDGAFLAAYAPRMAFSAPRSPTLLRTLCFMLQARPFVLVADHGVKLKIDRHWPAT